MQIGMSIAVQWFVSIYRTQPDLATALTSGRWAVQITAGTLSVVFESLRGSPQLLRAYSAVVPQDRFLPQHTQNFIDIAY
jgi:hypothetical protein